MHYKKLLWWLRAQLSRPFLKKVGVKTYLGKPCFIEGGKKIAIGNRVRIFPGVRMEAIGHDGCIIIGDNCAIEQNVHIISKDMVLSIGDDCAIAADVCITNLDHEYKDVSKSVIDQPCIVKQTTIGRGCFLGFGCTIQAGTVLGEHCIVGTRSVVRGTFPDNCVIVGVPAKIIKKLNPKNGKWEKV